MLRSGLDLLVFILLVVGGCAPVGQSPSENRQQAEVHYKLATAHLQANNPTLALKELLVAVRQDPQNSSIHVALAQAYQQKKAYPEAERHYLKALELSDGDPRYQNNIAALYLDMGEWDKAISYFDRAAQNLLFLNAHVAVAGKAYAYYMKNDFPTALKYFNEVHELAPRYAPAYFHQSQVYRAMGNRVMEKMSLQRAIDIAPQFLQARYRFAELLVDEKAYAGAQKELRTIIEFAPNSEWGMQAVDLLRSIPEE
ncbi:MAG: tetratricopeptide repeat protein [Desulfuromonadales bacterium]|nr:tetratricopeptide repeat protein [Desulfuromonadales bacterium]